jgi:AbrB family looped-hinge helix DNA binding protein
MEVGVMETVTVSPKYQIVIPRMVREALGIKPGQKVQVLQYQNRIEFIPLKRMKEMRGFLKGINTTVEREKDRL